MPERRDWTLRLHPRRFLGQPFYRWAGILASIAVASVAYGAQLTLEWTDNSDGQAAFSVERRTGTTGIYEEITQLTAGVTNYVDSSVVGGATYCYRVRAFDEAGYSDYSNEACQTPAVFDLTVTTGGTGSGTVTSSPVGINCGTDCFEEFGAATVVTLYAAPATGSIFAGWNGGGCTGTGACTLAGSSITVGAAFASAPTSYRLTVAISGPGEVVSSSPGISCGIDCSEDYQEGTLVTLTAEPSKGWKFHGWDGGGCSGTGSCTLRMTAATTVRATFTKTAKK